ncbi:M9 family metallopeptidase [Aliikangiella sp. G2MR2-5]|uniref:M9 family metallopeptidase n=1 Tax=Aliikangiella sp. G2MR2-5 TaxID=2788943 RepID=UPI0018AC8C2F|nr:M9 family metallopeptidase [Aliikangiella sp. G2MR2-5]
MKNLSKQAIKGVAVLCLSALGQTATAEKGVNNSPQSAMVQLNPAHIRVEAPVEPKHAHQDKQSKQPYKISQSLNMIAVQAAAACDTNGYASKSGQALVDHILNSDGSCINDLYDANATSFAAFSSIKMITVANAAANMASGYSAANGPNNINNLYYFLRTGYYHEYYSSDQVGPYGSDVQNAIRAALDNFVNNADFYNSSDQHGKNIQDAIVLIDSAGENSRYLPVVKQWLSRWDQTYASSWYIRASVNGIFTVLFRGHYQTDFQNATANDTLLIQQLGAFARSDWMLSSDALYLQENAAGELARFLQYSNAPIYPTVKAEVQAVLNRYDMNGTGKSVWLRVADVVDGFGQCAEFGICGFKSELEAQVLSLNHTCSATLKMRAEDMTSAQFADSCDKLSTQETFFHAMLQTGQNPVADDLNADLEMVIFNNSSSYKAHAGLFFGISTDNGGMYLEGDPTNANNQARFIAYEAEWMLPEFHIWNLTHEYVHYLDGRFNLYGDFGAAKTGTHKTVWWIEGLAEYISKQNRNDDAINLARTKQFSLSEIFSNNYNSGQDRVYRWGYLAVRFMFEKHHNDVVQLLDYFRAGDYDAYLNRINTIGTSYDAEWNSWLDNVQSTDVGPTPPGDGTPGQTELTNGVAVSGLSAAANGEDLIFYIDLPDGATNLSVKISGGSGDADLYVKQGDVPTDSSYDCRPYRSGNSESCDVSAPTNGRWFVRLKAYSAYSGVTLSASFDNVNNGAVELTKGVAQSGLSTAQPGDELMFFIDLPAGASDLNIQISGGTGDADIYVRHGSEPTDTVYDCRPYVGGNSETCNEATPQAGRWYVRVKAYQAFSGVTLVADYTAASGGFDACSTNSPVNYGNIEVDQPVCVDASNGKSSFYTYVPAGTSAILVEMSGGTGNADLYGNYDTWASDTAYQFSSVQGGNEEAMLMTNPPQGWIYISVMANPEHGKTSLRITHQ